MSKKKHTSKSVSMRDEKVNDPYQPKHMKNDVDKEPQKPSVPVSPFIPEEPIVPEQPYRGGDYIPQPDGTNVAPNGEVIRNPMSEQPEILPDNKYTDDQQDYDLLIM